MEEQIVKIEEKMETADKMGLDRAEPGDPSIGPKMGHVVTQAKRNGKRLEIIKK